MMDESKSMPPLTDAMRSVLRNDRGAYQSEDDLYAALCEAAGRAAAPTEEPDYTIDEAENAAISRALRKSAKVLRPARIPAAAPSAEPAAWIVVCEDPPRRGVVLEKSRVNHLVSQARFRWRIESELYTAEALAAEVEKAVLEERERCAKEAEHWQAISRPEHKCGEYIAAAIRGKG